MHRINDGQMLSFNQGSRWRKHFYNMNILLFTIKIMDLKKKRGDDMNTVD